MLRTRQLSTTSYPINFLMVQSVDHTSPATGKTVTVTLSKNGAAFGSAAAAVSEIGNGWYSLAGNATDRNSLGELLVHATATGCDNVDFVCNVVGGDPFDATRMGLTALPNANAGASGGLPTVDASNQVKANITAITSGIIVAASFAANALDAVWSTAARTLTAFDFNVNVGSITSGVAAADVLNAVAASYNTAGSIGNKINTGGSGGSGDVSSFSGAAATQMNDIQAHVDLIGTGQIIAGIIPVSSSGATQMVAGSSYYNADGLALIYTLNGYPALTVGTGNAVWTASAANGTTLAITGDTISSTQVRFELSPTQSAQLITGLYSLKGVINGSSHTLKTPNNTLTVLPSL